MMRLARSSTLAWLAVTASSLAHVRPVHPSSTLDESLPHSHHVIPWAQGKTGVPQSGAPGTEVSVANLDRRRRRPGGTGAPAD